MSASLDAYDELAGVLRKHPTARLYDDPGAAIDPPAILLVPPELEWSTSSPEPTSASFDLYVIVPQSATAARELMPLVESVVALVEPVADAVEAVPTALDGKLPAYLVTVEMEL